VAFSLGSFAHVCFLVFVVGEAISLLV